MTDNSASETSDVPNGEADEPLGLHIITETPVESPPMIPQLPETPLRPRHENPPPADLWDMLWFW